MRVLAYCSAGFADATARATGVYPLLSPPLSAATIHPVMLRGYDLLWFDFHGRDAAAQWDNNDGMVAITAEQIRRAELLGCTVFTTACWAGERDSPMLHAFLAAGARYVVAGAGPNWSGAQRVSGAARLGRWLRIGMGWGLGTPAALGVARTMLRMTSNTEPTKDSLRFEIFSGGDE